MDRVSAVSTDMIDIAAISQLLTEWWRGNDFQRQWPTLVPNNASQHEFLNWYKENWRFSQMVKIEGLISHQCIDLDCQLPQDVLYSNGFDRLGDNELGMVTRFDLSGGLGVSTQPAHIIADEKLYAGLQIDIKQAKIYNIPRLQFPLVNIRHSRTAELWMTIPNTPFNEPDDIRLFRFASDVMAAKNELFHRVRDGWAYIEVPKVSATVCHSAEWLNGLTINGYTLRQILQVGNLEISERSIWRTMTFGPQVASEVLEGPPAISFDRDFIVWTTHLRGQVISPVIHVRTDMWQEVK